MGYIYILTSPYGKSYIGQTTRPIEKRLGEHQYSKSTCGISGAIQYHGWDAFEKDWYECPDEDLNKHERWMVNLMGTLSPNGYNLREGGGSRGKHSDESNQKNREAHLGENNANFGIPRSKETKQKIGDGNRGKTQSDEAKRKVGDGNRGKTRTDEMNQRNREAQLGKTRSDETKQKQREANIGENNPMWGEHHTKETKQKMSESKKGEKNHNSKRVYQYTLDGTFINSFASTGEAESHLEKNGSSIRGCARGRRKTAYKFKWSYVKY